MLNKNHKNFDKNSRKEQKQLIESKSKPIIKYKKNPLVSLLNFLYREPGNLLAGNIFERKINETHNSY